MRQRRCILLLMVIFLFSGIMLQDSAADSKLLEGDEAINEVIGTTVVAHEINISKPFNQGITTVRKPDDATFLAPDGHMLNVSKGVYLTGRWARRNSQLCFSFEGLMHADGSCVNLKAAGNLVIIGDAKRPDESGGWRAAGYTLPGDHTTWWPLLRNFSLTMTRTKGRAAVEFLIDKFLYAEEESTVLIFNNRDNKNIKRHDLLMVHMLQIAKLEWLIENNLLCAINGERKRKCYRAETAGNIAKFEFVERASEGKDEGLASATLTIMPDFMQSAPKSGLGPR